MNFLKKLTSDNNHTKSGEDEPLDKGLFDKLSDVVRDHAAGKQKELLERINVALQPLDEQGIESTSSAAADESEGSSKNLEVSGKGGEGASKPQSLEDKTDASGGKVAGDKKGLLGKLVIILVWKYVLKKGKQNNRSGV